MLLLIYKKLLRRGRSCGQQIVQHLCSKMSPQKKNDGKKKLSLAENFSLFLIVEWVSSIVNICLV